MGFWSRIKAKFQPKPEPEHKPDLYIALWLFKKEPHKYLNLVLSGQRVHLVEIYEDGTAEINTIVGVGGKPCGL